MSPVEPIAMTVDIEPRRDMATLDYSRRLHPRRFRDVDTTNGSRA
jgi:hypothetical protein